MILLQHQKQEKKYTNSVRLIPILVQEKQGEIVCFDIAYILFADEENIPCFHFLLNDKKELMHGNQLVRIANLVERYKSQIQYVASILKDKLPKELSDEKNFIVKLSQENKLFRIENN